MGYQVHRAGRCARRLGSGFWLVICRPSRIRCRTPAAARHRLFRALAEPLTRLGVSVLAVEDALWADNAPLGLLVLQVPGNRGLAVRQGEFEPEADQDAARNPVHDFVYPGAVEEPACEVRGADQPGEPDNALDVMNPRQEQPHQQV